MTFFMRIQEDPPSLFKHPSKNNIINIYLSLCQEKEKTWGKLLLLMENKHGEQNGMAWLGHRPVLNPQSWINRHFSFGVFIFSSALNMVNHFGSSDLYCVFGRAQHHSPQYMLLVMRRSLWKKRNQKNIYLFSFAIWLL